MTRTGWTGVNWDICLRSVYWGSVLLKHLDRKDGELNILIIPPWENKRLSFIIILQITHNDLPCPQEGSGARGRRISLCVFLRSPYLLRDPVHCPSLLGSRNTRVFDTTRVGRTGPFPDRESFLQKSVLGSGYVEERGEEGRGGEGSPRSSSSPSGSEEYPPILLLLRPDTPFLVSRFPWHFGSSLPLTEGVRTPDTSPVYDSVLKLHF